MDASCSKDISSSSEFSKHFTESDESVYSETSSESDSDSYHSDEYDENNISRDLSAAVDSQNQNNDDQWIQIADQASDIIFNQFIQKHHQNQTVILIIQTNMMKTIFHEIYQLQLTLRIKIMMINGFR